jgi:hypothetical protein
MHLKDAHFGNCSGDYQNVNRRKEISQGLSRHLVPRCFAVKVLQTAEFAQMPKRISCCF